MHIMISYMIKEGIAVAKFQLFKNFQIDEKLRNLHSLPK